MLNQIDWQKLKEQISQFSKNETTQNRIHNMDVAATQSEAKKQVNDILSACEILEESRPQIESLDLVSLWLRRLNKGAILNPYELKDVRHFLAENQYFIDLFKEVENEWAKSYELPNFEKIYERLGKTIDSEGNILSDASPKLAELYKEKNYVTRNIQEQLKNIINKQGPENYLQDKFVTTREGRWVVPVKQGMQGKFKGIIHDISNSGQSVFIEPEAIVLSNNKLREVEIAIKDEIEAILKAITHLLKERKEDIVYSFEALQEIDFIFALAQWNLIIDGKDFNFVDNKLDLVQLRNPMLIAQGHKVVSNSITLSEDSTVLLVSGPNAGGKTILLKSLGLAAQMARCGLPICAESSSYLPFFQNIYISVGDSQNIREGLSTFAAHIEELNKSYEAKPFKDLVLIDEICGSTDPEEGAALARAFLKYYAEKKIFNLTTSHLSPLKTNWEKEEGVIIGSMDYDEERGLPNYQFLPGISGSSFAWKTAKKLGTPDDILDKAKNFLSKEWQEQNEKIDELETLKNNLVKEKKQSENARSEAESLKREYENKLKEIEKKKEEELDKYIKKAEKRLEDYLDSLKDKKNANVFEIKADLPNIIKKAEVKELSLEEFSEVFPPGTPVYITSLDKKGVVQSKPNAKGEVQILSNSMHLSVPYRFLEKTEKKVADKVFKPIKKASLGVEDKKLDLRGKTMEEALNDLEESLDEALREGSDRLHVIHGHGSGTLKKAIRNYCSRSDVIKKWQIAPKDKGGDGVTWIDL